MILRHLTVQINTKGVFSAPQESSRCFASSAINRCEVPKTSGNCSFNVGFKGTVAKRVANEVEHLTAASPYKKYCVCRDYQLKVSKVCGVKQHLGSLGSLCPQFPVKVTEGR